MKVKYYKKNFPCPSKGEVLITHNIKAEEVEYLINKKYKNQLFSKDKGSEVFENPEEKIKEFYKFLRIEGSKFFTSLSVRTDFSNSPSCDLYGKIALILNKNKIQDKTIIFNGDVQNLASNDARWGMVKTLNIQDTNLIEELKEIIINKGQVKPKSFYLEARLFRKLELDDIEEIFVEQEDNNACIMAEKLSSFINYKLCKDNIDILREKQRELNTEMKKKFSNFFSNFNVNVVIKDNNKSLFYDINLFKIEKHEDIDKLLYGAGFYIIFTDHKFNDNNCKFVIYDKFKAIYRGHCVRVKKRIESHLFNKKYNDKKDGTSYKICMKIEDGVSGINIDEDDYTQYTWYVMQWKMTHSTKIEREQAENAFDSVFGKPLACRER